MVSYVFILFGSTALAFSLIAYSQPLLRRYALARPIARSSHKVATPQGGGIFVVFSTVIAVALAVLWKHDLAGQTQELALVLGATVLLAVVGAIDDLRTISVVPRLILQGAAVAMVVVALPSQLRIVPSLPFWLERAGILLGGVWFVNLVNFMDGIDWMIIAEAVPLTAALTVFGLMGFLPPDATVVSVALCGALVGFAPFNRPVATLFLGDVGSLPVGLLMGWLLTQLALNGHFIIALLLPLYYVADSSITLLGRLIRAEAITQAHRDHFYQRALDRGLSVYQIVGRVFATNLALVAIAAITLISDAILLQLLAMIAGGALVGTLLWSLTKSK